MVHKTFVQYQADNAILDVNDFERELSENIRNRDVVVQQYKTLFQAASVGQKFDCDLLTNATFQNVKRAEILKRINERILPVSPGLLAFMSNFHPSADSQINEAILSKTVQITFENISGFKSYLRETNEQRWTRELNDNEKQGSVSVLGSISEKLLAKALGSLVDNENLFQTTRDDVKSYGDFVLLGLPNNLWFSVKSGFARERLLASGFANDLIGVGFFQDPNEFMSLNKVRNFKKVGFLAIYLPDLPVTEEQELTNTSTYEGVMNHYGNDRPQNINGSRFYRPLSELGNDISKLLTLPIKQRSIISF